MRSFRSRSGVARFAGWQNHHLIPVAVFASSSFTPALELLAPLGFDPFDFNTNGVRLPATELTALTSGLPLHRGPHPRYSDLVSCRFAAIVKPLLHCPGSRAAAYEAMERAHWLQRALFRALVSHSEWATLNARDPMSRNVAFRELENETDAIWQFTI